MLRAQLSVCKANHIMQRAQLSVPCVTIGAGREEET